MFSATITLTIALSIATSVPFLNCIIRQAWRFRACPRGSITTSCAPRLAACLKKVAATGWLSVGVAPITMMTSEFLRDLAYAVLADERLHQSLGIVHVVEAEAPFHAEALLVRRAVLAGDGDDLVVLDLIGELAADAAIGADAVDFAVGLAGKEIVLVHHRRRHQRAGRAGLHALTARNARAVPHRVVEVEHDLFVVAAPRHADHVVDLHLAAGADAQVAPDTGAELNRHRDMAAVWRGLLRARGQTARHDAHAIRPDPELGAGIVRFRIAVGL